MSSAWNVGQAPGADPEGRQRHGRCLQFLIRDQIREHLRVGDLSNAGRPRGAARRVDASRSTLDTSPAYRRRAPCPRTRARRGPRRRPPDPCEQMSRSVSMRGRRFRAQIVAVGQVRPFHQEGAHAAGIERREETTELNLPRGVERRMPPGLNTKRRAQRRRNPGVGRDAFGPRAEARHGPQLGARAGPRRRTRVTGHRQDRPVQGLRSGRRGLRAPSQDREGATPGLEDKLAKRGVGQQRDRRRAVPIERRGALEEPARIPLTRANSISESIDSSVRRAANRRNARPIRISWPSRRRHRVS